jgi:hypothetical protein
MSPGEQFALWSVRLSMVCYATALALRLLGRSNPVARWCWTIGLTLLAAHTVAVFGVYHHWSHAQAYAHTARRTADLTGWDWGGGLYFNYAFLGVWTFDALWWWLRPASYRRRALWIEALFQGYLAFIAINATIIFAAGAVRWTSVAILIVLATLAARAFCVSRP